MERFSGLNFCVFCGFQQYRERFLWIFIKLHTMALFKYFKHKAPQMFSFIGWNPQKFSPVNLPCLQYTHICDRIYERGLIHASIFSTLRLCNSACVWPTALKFGGRTVLSLHLYDRKFQLNSLLKNEVMPLKSCTIGCVYKTLFANPVTYSYIAVLYHFTKSFHQIYERCWAVHDSSLTVHEH